MSEALAYVAASIVLLWGLSHAIPTRQVVAGFGDISSDSRLVITQEWLAEALMMWFVAGLVIVTTAVGDPGSLEARWAYRTSAVALVAVGALTAATGARTPVFWFKICPVVLSTSASLLLAASLI